MMSQEAIDVIKEIMLCLRQDVASQRYRYTQLEWVHGLPMYMATRDLLEDTTEDTEHLLSTLEEGGPLDGDELWSLNPVVLCTGGLDDLPSVVTTGLQGNHPVAYAAGAPQEPPKSSARLRQIKHDKATVVRRIYRLRRELRPYFPGRALPRAVYRILGWTYREVARYNHLLVWHRSALARRSAKWRE